MTTFPFLRLLHLSELAGLVLLSGLEGDVVGETDVL
jgi:hypothetical protein